MVAIHSKVNYFYEWNTIICRELIGPIAQVLSDFSSFPLLVVIKRLHPHMITNLARLKNFGVRIKVPPYALLSLLYLHFW